MLDMAKERDGQPVVWGIQRLGDGDPHIRLWTNRVDRESADDLLVGAPEPIRKLRYDPVDRGPHPLLHQRQRPRTPFLTCTPTKFLCRCETLHISRSVGMVRLTSSGNLTTYPES